MTDTKLPSHLRREATEGWRKTLQIVRDDIRRLEDEIRELKYKEANALAMIETCAVPPTARNTLFPQRITARSEHFRSARSLGFRFVVWNDNVFLVESEAQVGACKDFGL